MKQTKVYFLFMIWYEKKCYKWMLCSGEVKKKAFLISIFVKKNDIGCRIFSDKTLVKQARNGKLKNSKKYCLVPFFCNYIGQPQYSMSTV